MIHFLREQLVTAGAMCKLGQQTLSEEQIEFKSPRDLVTVVDRDVERFLVTRIKERFPDHGIIGEEDGTHLSDSEYCWIIDPIDGTTSFSHGQPFFAVSIGLRKGSEMVAGGVFAPALDQLFLAERGGGAFLNDHRIAVSGCRTLNHAVLATGFACLRSGWRHNNLVYLNELLPEIRDIRRCGSAALDLAYVAAGKMDGFWELNLNLYDIAAGMLLVAEAGGTVSDFFGGTDVPEAGIVAANQEIATALITFTSRYPRPWS